MGETTSAVTALAGGQPCFKCGLMEFMLSQTQDNACQQSFVWEFFFGGGGGGVLKYFHRGLLGLTGSQLKSGHVCNAWHCFSACEVLCFPPSLPLVSTQ